MTLGRSMMLAGAAALACAGAALGQGASPFRDCAECPEMVAVPAGSFLMGAAPGEEEREQLREERGRSEPQVTAAAGRGLWLSD